MRRRDFLLSAFASAMLICGRDAAAAKPRFRTGTGGEMRTQEMRQALFKVSRMKLVEPSASAGDLPRLRLEVPSSSPRRPANHNESPPPRRIEPSAPPVFEAFETVRELALQPTSFTPYDRYLGTVRNVIANLTERDASMIAACSLMREGRSFRYAATDPYRAAAPSVTEARRAGDCKAKALWIYDQLGDPRALYVIGKLERRSKTSHAWVYWRSEDRWWILDPTDRANPIAADSVSSSRYVPYYSYGKAGAFRHRATSLLLASAAPTATGPTTTLVRMRAPHAAKSHANKRRRH